MSQLQDVIEDLYQKAEAGDWQQVLSTWQQSPRLAAACSRYREPVSSWSFLHQAACHGEEIACRELIRLGATVAGWTDGGQSAADVAEERGYSALAALLRQASKVAESLWQPVLNPNILPSSNSWNEAIERHASQELLVGYGGGVVHIPPGARHFVDAFGRILVGWHGTYDPPGGMDGETML